MGVLTDFFVATDEDVSKILNASDEPPDLSDLPHVEYKRVDHVKLAKLQHRICGTPFAEAIGELAATVEGMPDDDDLDWGLHRIPSQMQSGLARLSTEQVEATATWWAETDEMKADGFTPEDSLEIIRNLCKLAEIADRETRGLYLIWSL